MCLGGNVFGWTIDEATSFKILDAFVDAGFNFIDTADVYSKWAPGNKGGESETIVGKWLKRSGNRTNVIVATKVGLEMGDGLKGLSRDYIMSAVDASLRRLQTDYIDLYQSHTDDTETPLEETLGTFAELIEAGKVRVIGASNYKADRLAEALQVSKNHGLPAYRSLQPQYNLYDRADYETHLQPVCEQQGLGVIPYFPLAAGFLTGKYRSESDLGTKARAGTVKKYLTDRGLEILKALDEVSAQCGASQASVALAWTIAKPSITAPIASATSLEQLQQIVRAAELKLDAGAMEKLDAASSY